MQHSALFVGNTGTRADRAGDTVEAIDREVRRMAEQGPTAQELDEAKSYLKGSQMLALDSSSKLAAAVLQYQVDPLGIDYIARPTAIVDAVTAEASKQAAQRLGGQGLRPVVGAPGPNGGPAASGQSQAAAPVTTVAQVLGEITWLMTQSPRHKAIALGDLEWLVMPAILLRQFRIFYKGEQPVGVAFWALADDLVAKRIDAGDHRLAAVEWKSGTRLRIVDIVAPFGGESEMRAQVAAA